MFPEMFGYEDTLYGPRGTAHEVLEVQKEVLLRPQAVLPLVEWYYRPKRYYRLWSGTTAPSSTTACGAVLPLVHGTVGIRVGLFSCGLNRPCAGKTDLEEAFTPSLDPKAQHINRGAGLAHGTHQVLPSRVPATLTL